MDTILMMTYPLSVQVFTSIAKDVMQRLQQEQADQQQTASPSTLKLTSNLDNAKQRKKKGCCDTA
jgi:hypothetical protein